MELKTYDVLLTRSRTKVMVVEAENEDDAVYKAMDEWNDEPYVLHEEWDWDVAFVDDEVWDE